VGHLRHELGEERGVVLTERGRRCDRGRPPRARRDPSAGEAWPGRGRLGLDLVDVARETLREAAIARGGAGDGEASRLFGAPPWKLMSAIFSGPLQWLMKSTRDTRRYLAAVARLRPYLTPHWPASSSPRSPRWLRDRDPPRPWPIQFLFDGSFWTKFISSDTR